MFDIALVERLLVAAPLIALVADRVNFVERPGEFEDGGPGALTLQTISAGRDYHFKGSVALHRPRIQFDAWALDVLTAKLIKNAALDVMEPEALGAGVRFGPSFLVSERDMQPETTKAGQLVFRTSFDLFVWWNAL